jgi:hypothetical protein
MLKRLTILLLYFCALPLFGFVTGGQVGTDEKTLYRYC